MLTILNAIELSTEYLKEKGVDSPRSNAELLLADVLNCKRMDLYLRFDQPLAESEKNSYRDFIRRRGEREPLQYILGKVEFYGLEFYVSPSVLIPRQETEILVDHVLSDAKNKIEPSILDIGTGCGNIAIALNKYIKNSKIYSIDISSEAVDIALKNAQKYNLDGNIKFENIGFEDLISVDNMKFDYIVSNPPYVSLDDYSSLEPELLDFEPKIALTDNNDGYSFFRSISGHAPQLLKKGGKLFFEIGYGQSEKVFHIMQKNGIEKIQIFKDFQNIDRIISGEVN